MNEDVTEGFAPPEEQGLTLDLLAALGELDDYLKAYDEAYPDSRGAELDRTIPALRNLARLVPMLLDDYSVAWDMFEITRQAMNETVVDTERKAKEALSVVKRPGLILP